MEKKIKVNIPASPKKTYEIVVGISLENAAADIAKLYPNSTCFIITDTNVYELYAKRFEKWLLKRGVQVYTVKFKAGEKFKTRRTKEFLEDRILKLGVKRDSIIIALGGGVVGDIAGFTAATLERGIPFIQIPTTLLAQVDSSVGGKVAVDHLLGKNLIGAFYQPKRVYIDPNTLATLSDSEYCNGLAEVVKYGAVLDQKFFGFLEKNWIKIIGRDIKTLTFIIERCCFLKAEVVKKDELETNYRRILNFGHTIGHALELISNFKVGHGNAVSIGMIVEGRIAERVGILSRNSVHQITALLLLFGLPIRIPDNIKISNILKATRQDEKAIGSKINYTLLSRIGEGVINVALSVQDVKRALADR